jgi:hypothetical protein
MPSFLYLKSFIFKVVINQECVLANLSSLTRNEEKGNARKLIKMESLPTGKQYATDISLSSFCKDDDKFLPNILYWLLNDILEDQLKLPFDLPSEILTPYMIVKEPHQTFTPIY